VGCNAIQLAVASGYTCVATASARNADMLKKLGASEVFDHSRGDVVDAVIKALRGRHLAGVIHATGKIDDSLAVAAGCEGSRKVAVTLPPPENVPNGVTATHIIGPSLKDDEIGPMIYRDFLPRALSEGSFVPAPSARVTGHGLNALQEALETLKVGVSAAKIVVTLD
jgi:Zn-dependent alcohol dehydrogenase